MDFGTHLDGDSALWECYYELAIAEKDPHTRLRRIAEAQQAMLFHAKRLEERCGTDAECQALEDAADVLQCLKIASVCDGVSQNIEE